MNNRQIVVIALLACVAIFGALFTAGYKMGADMNDVSSRAEIKRVVEQTKSPAYVAGFNLAYNGKFIEEN